MFLKIPPVSETLEYHTHLCTSQN